MSVLEAIVARRRARIAREGHELGASVPATRLVPVVPFGSDPFLVCEVKRRSPSRGDIAPALDAAALARAYAERGARSVSVLTEMDHFGGSLDDLVRVKREVPGLSLLRKDFILDEEDVEVSWRAGADAVLLIASILDGEALARLHRAALDRGLVALVEVRDRADAGKCRAIAPGLTGINCRDLATFAVDLAHPLTVKPAIDWQTRLLFESGIRSPEDVRFARSAGFAGALVGEAAVRSPDLVRDLLAAFDLPGGDFWARLYARRTPDRPLVKICGITRPRDAEAAVSLGADALGFVFAPSPRRADPALLRDLRHLAIPKVAVVVSAREGGRARLDADVARLLTDGHIDAVQFHGDESPDECPSLAFPYYKALRLRSLADVEAAADYRSPRVLVDAFCPDAAGGTGKEIPRELAREAGRHRPLWLAGGIGPDNVGAIIGSLAQELIDASSRLESSPGVKDRAKFAAFFEEIRSHAAAS